MTERPTFFDPHQRAVVAAAMARIIPSDDGPGAAEAGCVDFVDAYLSGLSRIRARPDGGGFLTLEGREGWAWRRRIAGLRDAYSHGIIDLDGRANRACGADFVELAAAEQDAVLGELERAELERGAPRREGTEEQATAGYGSPPPALQQTSAEMELPFFSLLCTHTRQGFYCDPVYGGNRERVGWELIGFPGPRSLAEVHEGRYSTLPWFALDTRHPSMRGPSS